MYLPCVIFVDTAFLLCGEEMVSYMLEVHLYYKTYIMDGYKSRRGQFLDPYLCEILLSLDLRVLNVDCM